ncbi:hypothetical protein Dalk_2644 [Desulfatibacillum aliphaticivorans]|uniref:Knr4/Smi1-like domain-containing protein n=1 Tax=Desulfatibacillum aliphaticivorans TaxID=218208 RepID=B8FIU6_DESAL|nr:SMI1/KNR4 family protein [Desulfatibacillum aliphaticivorans]ACL04337.1 hypothetical protein Dalk_2644 [Desulfatibacillum aliphaticivorans]
MTLKSRRVQTVEKELGIELHPQYVKYLDQYGYYCSGYVEVFGYTEKFIGIDGYPCIIFTTKRLKDTYHLGPNHLLIAHTEDSDYVAVLDNDTGEVFETDINGERTLVASSFDEWFAMVRKRGYI